jgi:hypothetical protein
MFGDTMQPDIPTSQLLFQLHRVHEASGESIQLPDNYHVEPTSLSSGKHLLEHLSVSIASADCFVTEDV